MEFVSTEERLVATLRFLATGRNYEDLKFSTIISPQLLELLLIIFEFKIPFLIKKSLLKISRIVFYFLLLILLLCCVEGKWFFNYLVLFSALSLLILYVKFFVSMNKKVFLPKNLFLILNNNIIFFSKILCCHWKTSRILKYKPQDVANRLNIEVNLKEKLFNLCVASHT